MNLQEKRKKFEEILQREDVFDYLYAKSKEEIENMNAVDNNLEEAYKIAQSVDQPRVTLQEISNTIEKEKSDYRK